MKNKLLLAVGSMALLTACDASKGNEMGWFDHAVKTAGHQLLYMAEQLKNEPDTACFPRSIKEGKYRLEHPTDWTSGFYPGSMWLAYELTGDEALAKEARKYTNRLQDMQYYTGNHDLGFMMFCSYGQGIRLKPEPTDSLILIHSSESLCSRFRPEVGLIRSWDFGDWSYPVIIDNMMNLELLFWATKESKDSTFYRIAVDHARTTMKHHFRPDFSSYHVIDYDTITGQVLKKNTHQGFADESAWSRGQAWALYGYTMCYRETRLPEFLEQAQNIEKYLFTHPNMPEDLIPYWDFDAPGIPDEPRDVSAATVIASALYELSLYDPEKGERYRSNADKIIENLTKHYRAMLKKDNGFLLLHSTGTKPTNTEVDVPIVYADYYFIEALMRKNKLEKTGKQF